MSDSPIIYPPVVDYGGRPVDSRADDYIEGYPIGPGGVQVNHTWGTAGMAPLGWNNGAPDGSRMVGWTLRQPGRSQIIQAHAFSINPQSIARTPSSRNQLFATQDSFYVDDFGPGTETIQINQLVAHGRATVRAGGSMQRATAREDVVRFYDLIYTRMVANPGKYELYFHDNHFWDAVDGKTPERVYFPPQAVQITRSVQLHNVWQLSVTMQTLDPAPREAYQAQQVPGLPKVRTYVVRKGDTLTKIAARLAGRKPTHKRVLQLTQQIEALTKKYGKDDITKTRTVPVYNAHGQWTGNRHVNRMHLAVGEKIILPMG